MEISSKQKLGFSLVFIVLSVVAVLVLVGSPETKNEFSTAEMQQAKELGKSLAVMMGEISASADNCPAVLERLSVLKEEITPLSEKLFRLDADYISELDYRSVTDLLEASNWIEKSCHTQD